MSYFFLPIFLGGLWFLWVRQAFVSRKTKTDTDRIIYHIYTAAWLLSLILVNGFAIIAR